MTFTREDYELAALAAGIEITGFKASYGAVVRRDGMRLFWNPPYDDGDALRLANACHMHLGIENQCTNAWQGGMNHWQTVANDGDIDKATRHAIFRAAVEIGRQMKEKGL